ncbi:MAG: hypothetical protein V2A73_02935 [Pseudomonadota bacterium]
MKFAEYCTCGAGCKGEIRPDSAARRVLDIFWSQHRELGCGPATSQDAANARRRAERSSEREEMEFNRRLQG